MSDITFPAFRFMIQINIKQIGRNDGILATSKSYVFIANLRPLVGTRYLYNFVVIVMSKILTGPPSNSVSILVLGKRFLFFFQSVQTGCVAHQTFSSVATEDFSQGVKTSRCNLINQPR